MKRVYTLNETAFRRLIRKETLAMSHGNRSRFFDRLLEADEADMSGLDISKGPTAAIAWLNGPGADPKVRELLARGLEDGSPNDEEAKISETSKTIGDLEPTQREIELTKSVAYPLANFDAMKNMISGGVKKIGPPGNDMIVTSGNLIIDGHHRWSSLFSMAGPEGQIAALDIELPEKDAASVLAITQAAIASTLTKGQPVPKAGAGKSNILGKSKDQIFTLIMDVYKKGGGESGAILTQEFMESCMQDPAVVKHFGLQEVSELGNLGGIEDARGRKGSGGAADATKSQVEAALRGRNYNSRSGHGNMWLLSERPNVGALRRQANMAREIMVEKIADNLSQMNNFAEGSPPRVDMPQLDKAVGGVRGALDNLEAGAVNYKAPFGESVERWQRLAGIIKG